MFRFLLVVFLSLVSLSFSLYTSNDDVVILTPQNFDAEVIQSSDVWLIEFYAPWCGHCKALTADWKKAATALKGVVKIGAVDADQHGQLGSRFGVRGFPTIKIFGEDKNQPQDYNGARQAAGIVDAALQQVKRIVQSRLSGSGGHGRGSGSSSGDDSGGSAVVELTDANFESTVLNSDDLWMVEFFAPWCGHCKTLAPQWAKAASELKGKVKLGALDATVHTVMSNRYEIRGFPTIKIFHAGKVNKGTPVDYDGGRSASDIVQWALERVADNIETPEVKQLTSQSVMEEACNEKQLCVISILPHILDCQSECRNAHIKRLEKQAEDFKRQMWGWVWAEAGMQPQLEVSLGIGGFGYPAMVVVNARKGMYSPLRGSFSDAGLHDFLMELSFGRGSTIPIAGAKLTDIEATDSWDGKDGAIPEMDDIDLSDVDLDDFPTKSEL